MMPARQNTVPLLERLPQVRGRLDANEPLARYTWFKVGGAAEVLFRPEDEDDLCQFLSRLADDIPLTIIGNASNLLIRDGGIPGVVIRLGGGFAGVEVNGLEIIAGAGAADLTVARKARDVALAGFEFLSGIPGTIGGAAIMNAGAYGTEIGDICISIRIVDRKGQCHDIPAEDLGFTYRHARTLPGGIVTAVRLRGAAGERNEISARMDAIQKEREVTQPVRTLTGGSTFRNPPGEKAWQLIDQAGCRGLERGRALVSDLHCNFLINEGGATAADLEGLGEEVRRRVFKASGVNLEWEIKRIGVLRGTEVKEIGE